MALTIENELPRIMSFRGKALVLLPGTNEDIDEAVFMQLWNGTGNGSCKVDPTLKWYYSQAAFTVWKDGAQVKPSDDAEEPTKPLSKVLTGPSHRVASSMTKPETVADRLDPPPKEGPVDDIEPKRVGGGVPGNLKEAKERVAMEESLEQLKDWRRQDERVTIHPFLDDRIEAMEGLQMADEADAEAAAKDAELAEEAAAEGEDGATDGEGSAEESAD